MTSPHTLITGGSRGQGWALVPQCRDAGHRVTLITGGSRGLGWALVQQCLDAGHRVLSIARRAPPATPPGLTVWTRDLEDALPVSEDLGRWLSAQSAPSEVNLINNAGVISELCDLAEGGGAD
ncbi:MAG: hypothetical protein MUE35_12855, partial [Hydrogenophaga sp.]|nr:hypothetical protein [Hydrogenophaga sp.]